MEAQEAEGEGEGEGEGDDGRGESVDGGGERRGRSATFIESVLQERDEVHNIHLVESICKCVCVCVCRV